jgi:DNA transformation protein
VKTLRELPNIGRILAGALEGAGISSAEELKKAGSVEALFMINGAVLDAGCLNKLYALEGAIRNVRWHFLEQAIKDRIRTEYFARIGKA